MEQVRAIIVEDKSVVAEDLKMCLDEFGYTTLGVCHTGVEAIDLVQSLEPDILLMDINLNGPMDGVETVRRINEVHPLPVIYLTAYSDDKTIERARSTHPAAYLVKPFDPVDLKIAIGIAIDNFQQHQKNGSSQDRNGGAVVKDSIFVKHGEMHQKVALDQIYFLEADGSYTKIHTPAGVFTTSLNMKAVFSLLPDFFLKVHRSYVVNLQRVTGFDRTSLYIQDQVIPVSLRNRELLAEKFLKI